MCVDRELSRFQSMSAPRSLLVYLAIGYCAGNRRRSGWEVGVDLNRLQHRFDWFSGIWKNHAGAPSANDPAADELRRGDRNDKDPFDGRPAFGKGRPDRAEAGQSQPGAQWSAVSGLTPRDSAPHAGCSDAASRRWRVHDKPRLDVADLPGSLHARRRNLMSWIKSQKCSTNPAETRSWFCVFDANRAIK